MAIVKPVSFEDYQIPILLKETVGNVTFVAVRSDKFVFDGEGQRTDELKAQSIEVSSEKQRENFNVDLPPLFNLSALNLKFGDSIEIEGVNFCEAWAMLAPDDNNISNANTGFSMIAESIRKVQASPKQTVQSNDQKSENKGDKKGS